MKILGWHALRGMGVNGKKMFFWALELGRMISFHCSGHQRRRV